MSDVPPSLAVSSASPDGAAEKVWTLNERLTAWTLKARDQRELQGLFSSNSHKLNAANVVAMLTQLSWLRKGSARGGKGQQAVHTFAAELVGRLMELLPSSVEDGQALLTREQMLDIRERIQAASSLARLGYNGIDHLAGAGPLVQLLLRSLPDFRSPRDFAEATWAIAKLGQDPGQHWIASMLDLSRPKVQLLNIAELGNIVWALAKWGYRPGPVWMTMFLGRCTYVLNELEMKHDASGGGAVAKARISSVVALRGGKALAVGSGDVRLTSTNIVGALTSLTWGLAMLRTKLPSELERAVLIEAEAQFPGMSDQALANMAWALCRMDIKPPVPWVEGYLGHCFKAMPYFKVSTSFTNIIWALANWRVAPDEKWRDQLMRCCTPLLPSFDGEQLAVLLQGLSDMQHQPSKAWVSLCMEVYHKQHSGASAKSTITVLWAASKLLQTRVEIAGSREGGSQADAYAASGAAFHGPGKVWVKFYRPLLQDLATSVAPSLPTLPARQLVDLLVALADLGHDPGPVWLRDHERCCNAAVRDLTAYQVNLLSKAMRTLAQLGTYSAEELQQQPQPIEATAVRLPRQFLGSDGSAVPQVFGAVEMPRVRLPSGPGVSAPGRRLETGGGRQSQQAVRREEAGQQPTGRPKPKMMPLPPPPTGH